MSNCPACGTPYKEGVFSANRVLNKSQIALINEYLEVSKRADSYCDKCGKYYLDMYKNTLDTDIRSLRKKIQDSLGAIKLLSIESPMGWSYESVNMLSAQSVTGTGVLSELSADFNDLFGGRSNTLSGKLKSGEDFCKSQLRLQAAELGCHAVVGIDIDYSEVGSLRGMMMVCMAGTAIRLTNTNVLGHDTEVIDTLLKNVSRANYLGDMQRAI